MMTIERVGPLLKRVYQAYDVACARAAVVHLRHLGWSQLYGDTLSAAAHRMSRVVHTIQGRCPHVFDGRFFLYLPVNDKGFRVVRASCRVCLEYEPRTVPPATVRSVTEFRKSWRRPYRKLYSCKRCGEKGHNRRTCILGREDTEI